MWETCVGHTWGTIICVPWFLIFFKHIFCFRIYAVNSDTHISTLNFGIINFEFPDFNLFGVNRFHFGLFYVWSYFWISIFDHLQTYSNQYFFPYPPISHPSHHVPNQSENDKYNHILVWFISPNMICSGFIQLGSENISLCVIKENNLSS